MSKIVTQDLLKKAALCFRDARKNIYAGAALLYEIDQTNAWEGKYSSFTEYAEQECQISRGFASQLLQVWKYYVVERGVFQKNFYNIDYQKLYWSTKLPSGSTEQRLVKAREWTREEFRAELSTVDGEECAHPEASRVILCGKCGRRIG